MRKLTRNAEESEKSIESYLRREVEAAGGRCLKYYNAMERGYPDRIVMMKGGILVWVEIKSKGRKPTVLQEARMMELRDLWQNVAVVSSRREVDELIAHFADESGSYCSSDSYGSYCSYDSYDSYDSDRRDGSDEI